MSIEEFSHIEHQMVVSAEERYGDYFTTARDVSLLLSNIISWPTKDCDIFLRFLSQMKKSHTLSLMSLVRQHRIQAKMTLRYFLESTVHAAFSLVHVDTKNYFDTADGKKYDPQKASRAANAWIDKHFKTHSDEIKRVKDLINEQTAHANVYNSFHNFEFIGGKDAAIYSSYFDFDDDHWLKVDLWECAQAGLVAADLILSIRKVHGGFIPSRDADKLPQLIEASDRLSVPFGNAEKHSS
ncbi:hypothetical protein [Paraburkholderia fungorum]|uniref:HEPN AbiU2-like domain-containing protein n=1 Tax=Paraburkholderia fungorum TaxID=134537 RepID=A0AAW3V061_9BURK|nr:hypothetical protein [Paraburkholderia fungorum]MBB4517237.1 hypothetical protein [Paraburkholderia fungorum]MBB6204305.1 hypothetical protein [Paraburkholderia fungorum]